jgi:hypothetical protein
METSDLQEFGTLWSDAREQVDKTTSPSQIDLAFEILKKYDINDIRAALVGHMSNPDTGQFAPKPADIVKHIEGSKGTRSARAWTKVEKAIRQVGSYQTVVFDDPTIHAVIDDLGGWIKICEVTEHELPFKAKEFETRYQGYALNGIPECWPKKLTGMCEHQNATQGFKSPPPVLIGNQERAQRVFDKGGTGGGLQITRGGAVAKMLNAPKAGEK